MPNCLKVLIVASEISPYIKSGGLGDVIGSLPKALKSLGVDVRVVFPKYKNVTNKINSEIEFLGADTVPLGWMNQKANFYTASEDINIYMIENDYYFNRDGIYGFEDDHERFMFFTKATLSMLPIVEFKPDIVHFNDWQCALGSVYLKTIYKGYSFYKNIKSIYTIHNIQYQGLFSMDVLQFIVSNKNYEATSALEFYGKVNFMKGGIVYADAVNTVSNSYAKEIQTSEYSYGLEGVLQKYNYKLFGIINGIDTNISPEKDENIYKNYSVNTLEDKYINKEQLQKELNLPVKKDVPIFAIISRLVDQKGLDLIEYAKEEMLKENIQLVILGTGQEKYEHMFKNMQQQYPDKVRANIFFNEKLAMKIYAAADIFLMPSLFEPCGLGQLMAMKYGTVPVVRKTGGLQDTVIHYDEKTNIGNGFIFDDYDKTGLLWGFKEALKNYEQGKKHFEKIIKNGMNCDYSWGMSAVKYVEMYKSVKNKKVEK